MCWNYAYLIFSLEHQCVRNLNNNATHIYIVEMYDVMVDSHTLFTYPCSMLFDKYDTNAAPKSFYMCQIYDHPFHQTFYLVYLGLNLLVSSSNNPAMNITINAYFFKKCNTHNRILPCTMQT